MLPNLRGLNMLGKGHDFQSIGRLLYPQLTEIYIVDASLGALSLLPSLALWCPQLRELTMNLKLSKVPLTLPLLPPCGGALFPSLQKLNITTKIQYHTQFLQWCSKLALVKFTANCPFSTADEVHHLFSAASHGISHSSLTEFTFRNFSNSADHLIQPIRPQSLRSLLHFHNLLSVSVLAVEIDLDDTTVVDMARLALH